MSQTYAASGDLYGALLDSNKNKASGYLELGDAYPVKLEVKLKQKKQKSAQKGKRGQVVDSGARIDEIVGSLGLKNWVAKNIAMLVSGTAVEVTAASGTVTAQDVSLPADNSWVPLGKRNVSAVVIATKVAGVDYEVKPSLGFIRGLKSTAETVEVAYSHAGMSGYKIDIGTNSVIRMAVMIDGQNDENGDDFVCELDSVVFIPKSPLALISDPETDYEEMEFDLVIETLPGKTSPGTINGFSIGG